MRRCFELLASPRRLAGVAAVLLVPFLYLYLALEYRATPAAAVRAKDAGYYYLLNSYLVAKGELGHYVAHPGATLQLWGGLVAKVKSMVAPESAKPLDEEFLQHHEQYMRALALSLIVFNFLLLAWAGASLRREGLPFAAVMPLQLLFFFSSTGFQYTGLYQPEAIHAGLGAALLVALYARKKRMIAIPLLAGGAFATKLPYLPYLLLCALLPRRRHWAAAGLLSAAVFLLFCLVFYSSWGHAFLHFWRLAVNRHDYVEGAPGLPELALVIDRLRSGNFYVKTGFVPIVIALCAFGLGFRGADRENRKKLLIAGGILLLQTLLYLRKPTHHYYALPALSLVPTALAAYLVATKGNWRRWIGYAALAGVVLWNYPFFQERLELVEENNRNPSFAQLEKLLAGYPDCQVLISGPVPHGVDALEMGASWAGGRWKLEMERQFPRFHFLYNDFNISARGPEVHYVKEGAWLDYFAGQCVVFLMNSSIKEEARKHLRIVREGKELSCDIHFCAYHLEIKRRAQ